MSLRSKYIPVLRLIIATTLLVSIQTHASQKVCSLSILKKASGFFSKELKQKGIKHMMLDQYTEQEITERHKIAMDIARKAEAIEQASPRDIVTPAPVTLAHIQKITQRILKQWPYKHPKISIFLTSLQDYGPFITKDSKMILPIGFIDKAESDDELAFILAHELSHILLGHVVLMENNATAKRNLRIIKKAGQASASIIENRIALKKDATPEEIAEAEKINQRVLSYYKRFRKMMTDVLHPSWQKSHEDEADLLGMELYLQAGYSWEGMEDGLENLKETEQSACEALMAFSGKMESFIKTEVSTKAEKINEKKDSDGNLFIKNIKKFSTSQMNKILMSQVLPKTHKAYDKRIKYIYTYAEREPMLHIVEKAEEKESADTIVKKIKQHKEYKKLLASAISIPKIQMAFEDGNLNLAESEITKVTMTSQQGRLLKHELRLKQNKKKKAIQNIEIAINNTKPSLSAFEKYVQYKFEENKFNDIKSQITRATKLFHDEYHFMPELVYLSAKKTPHNLSAKKQLFDQCLASNRDRMEGPCYAAYLGQRPDFRENYHEILAAVDCETKKNDGSDVVCKKKKSNPIANIKNIFTKKDKD